MSAALIDSLLAGAWPDPQTGQPVSVPIRTVVIADSLAGDEADLVAALDLGRRLAVVSDPATHAVLGQRLERALATVAEVVPLRLPHRPHADGDTVERLRPAIRNADAVIAIGSGTINDLCKYAAFLEHKPYAVFGTAPSMNGYSSANAAIKLGGLKKSLAARTPAGVFLDLGVLAAAPPRMIRSGLGDSLCRPTAQADWLLSHLLRGTPYREAPFALLLPEEAALFESADGLLAGDLAAMGQLARTLVLSGLGMVICDGSYPASQGEHLISHYAEMMGKALPESFHGEQIGVATLTMARLQEQVLKARPVVRPTQLNPQDLEAHFGREAGAACLKELRAKALDAVQAERINSRIADGWDDIRARVASVTRPVALLDRALAAAGAPRRPADLGWSAEFYGNAVRRARQIRNRYTFLDLAGDAGLLDPFAASEAGICMGLNLEFS